MHPSTRIQEGFKFGGVVLPRIKISVFGAKMLSIPETPGFEHSGRNSGYKPGYSGFGILRGKLRTSESRYSGYESGYSGFY